MKFSRRTFIAGTMAAAVGALSVAYAFRKRIAWRPSWLRDGTLARALVPDLPNGTPGALKPDTLATLLALPAALVGRDLDAEHYTEFFRFRAETLPGYREVYESFATAIASASGRLSIPSFMAATLDKRRSALMRIGLTPVAPSPAERLRMGRSVELMDEYVVREVLRYLSRTDAWVLAGYGGWPGQARTVDFYLSPSTTRR